MFFESRMFCDVSRQRKIQRQLCSKSHLSINCFPLIKKLLPFITLLNSMNILCRPIRTTQTHHVIQTLSLASSSCRSALSASASVRFSPITCFFSSVSLVLSLTQRRSFKVTKKRDFITFKN